MKIIKTCLDCPFHKVINDSDPYDWFNQDDEAIICLKTKNPNKDLTSPHAADRSEYRHITVACRPYNLEKEADIPKWCPEGHYKTTEKDKDEENILVL